MAHLLPDQLGNAVLNYLASKPFNEVAQMVQAMQQLKEVPDDIIEKMEDFTAKDKEEQA